MGFQAAVVYENLADDGTVTAGSSILLAQPATVQNEHVRRRWRSLSAASHLLFDLGSSQSVDTIAIIGLTASTIRVRVSNADSTAESGDLYDSGTTSVDQAYLQSIHVLATPITARYVRVDLVHATLGYVECGRGVIGLRSAFDYNFAYGVGRTFGDPSQRSQTRDGQTQINPENTYRILDLPFDFISEADRYGFVETMDRVNALQKDVLWLTNPDSANLARDTVWGLMTDVTPVNQPFFEAFSKQYRIEERR